MKAHEVFKKANLVSRPDKALILGFISGIRENPRPSAENVIDIKLGESEVIVPIHNSNNLLIILFF